MAGEASGGYTGRVLRVDLSSEQTGEESLDNETLRSNYYQHMVWNPDTGKPRLETLEGLRLAQIFPDLRD